jgi:transcriptional regulatory protein GAL4
MLMLNYSQIMVDHQVRSQLIDAYFSTYHVSYPFVHEGTFRAQYNELIPRTEKRSWDMLLSTILALGAWTLGDARTDLDGLLYQQACAFGEDSSIFESASLTLVQALLLLSNFTQKRNRPNTGWNYLGLAIRMALSLGLHRELPHWGISILQREMRRRVWWGLFIFDSGASTTFGRAILLPQREMIDVKHVLNIHDQVIIILESTEQGMADDKQLLTPRTETVPAELLEPTIYSAMKAQVDFHLITNHISNRLLSSPPILVGEALLLKKDLERWADTLPSYFRLEQETPTFHHWYLFARARLWWRCWNLEMILFRPILLRAAMRILDHREDQRMEEEEEKARDICLNSAHMTIASIHEYVQAPILTRLVEWYSLYGNSHIYSTK